jgi:hypothetical protein
MLPIAARGYVPSTPSLSLSFCFKRRRKMLQKKIFFFVKKRKVKPFVNSEQFNPFLCVLCDRKKEKERK